MTNNSVTPRVLFLNPWDRLTGPNRYLVEMLRQVPKLAMRSTVAFHEANNALEEYQELGCQVRVWPEIALIHPRLDVRNIAYLLLNHTLGLVRMVRQIRAIRPQVIVSNTENLWTGGIAARLQGIPHVQVVHSLTFKYRWHRLANIVKIYFRWLSLFANYFIGVSEAVKQMLMELGIEARKITVVPNGFDTKEIREKAGVPLPTGLEQLICGHHPVFISVSRIAPMKGQDVLIKAIARIRHIYPSVVCLMVGCRGADNGTEDTNRFFDDLKSEIQRLELQECIHFLGEVDYVPELLHRGDVYVHPSLTESFSRVVAEALICGKPVVSSDAGGIPETVGHHGALLVPAGDAEALSQALIRVLNEEPLRGEIVSRGQAYVEENYQASFTARKFSHVLSAVVENKVIGHGKRITSQTAS